MTHLDPNQLEYIGLRAQVAEERRKENTEAIIAAEMEKLRQPAEKRLKRQAKIMAQANDEDFFDQETVYQGVVDFLPYALGFIAVVLSIVIFL